MIAYPPEYLTLHNRGNIPINTRDRERERERERRKFRKGMRERP
jgi:hypothetical protein